MTRFDDFIEELKAEAEAEGPEAVAQFGALDQHFAVGAQLLRRRRELHLSQTQLAERSGVPQAEISRIERGTSNPTLATIGHLLSALGDGRVWLDWGATSSRARSKHPATKRVAA